MTPLGSFMFIPIDSTQTYSSILLPAKTSKSPHVPDSCSEVTCLRAQRVSQEIIVLKFRPHASNGNSSRHNLLLQEVVVYINFRVGSRGSARAFQHPRYPRTSAHAEIPLPAT